MQEQATGIYKLGMSCHLLRLICPENSNAQYKPLGDGSAPPRGRSHSFAKHGAVHRRLDGCNNALRGGFQKRGYRKPPQKTLILQELVMACTRMRDVIAIGDEDSTAHEQMLAKHLHLFICWCYTICNAKCISVYIYTYNIEIEPGFGSRRSRRRRRNQCGTRLRWPRC